MNVLVIGGSGFVGAAVIEALLIDHHTVWATHRRASQSELVAARGATPLLYDPATADAKLDGIDRLDVVISLIPLSGGLGEELARLVSDLQPARLVVMSSAAVYTQLTAPTRERRIAGEAALVASSLSAQVLRPTMIYGGVDDANLARLVKLVRRFPIVPVPGNGRSLFQPVFVKDLARVVAWSVCSEHTATLDVGGPEPVTLAALVEAASAVTGRRVRVVRVPMVIIRPGVRLAEWLTRGRRGIRVEQLDRLQEDKAVDLGQLAAIGPVPTTSLAQGLAEIVAQLDEPSVGRARVRPGSASGTTTVDPVRDER